MLKEIDDKLTQILQEKIAEIPKENIGVNVPAGKLPAVTISNLKFKFENGDLAENIDSGKVKLEEKFSGDGVKVVYKLKEEPLKNSIQIECPLGSVLAEKDSYSINYDDGSIKFRKAPVKGNGNICVKYKSQKSIMTVKTLKLKALYSIDLLGGNGLEADLLAEKVVKALLEAEEELVEAGLEVKPVGGEVSMLDKNAKVQLRYIVEKTMRVEQIVGPMERIEITRRNI